MSISHHEASNIVNIAQQVKQGEIPSNESIKKELDPLKEHLAERERLADGLGKEGVMKATRELVEAIEDTLDTKNEGDKLQKLAQAAAKVAKKTAPALPSANRVWDETKEFVEALKDLTTSLVDSKEFRKALVDLFDILKDILQLEEEKTGVMENVKKGIEEGKPMEAAQKIADKANEAVKNLPDEIPEEQKKELRKKLKNLLVEIRDQAQTSFAFKKFFKFLPLLQKQVLSRLQDETIDDDVKEVEKLSIELIDSFLKDKSVKSMLDRVKSVVEQIQNDKDLREYIGDCKEFIERSFQQPELIESDKYYDEAEKLYERGRKLTNKYKDDRRIKKLLDEASDLLFTLQSDEQLNQLQYRAQKVINAFTYTDMKGNTQIDYDLVASMREEVIPFFIERMKEIPISGFRLESEEFEFLEVHDLYVTLGDMLPDKIKIHAKNDTNLTLKDLEKPVESESMIKFMMEGLRPEFKDFYFMFKRRGLVGISDEGRASLSIKGKGVCIYINFNLELDKENRTILGKHKVEIKMDQVELEILDANHKTLLSFAASIFAQKIQSGIELALHHSIDKLGGDWALYINKKMFSQLPSLSQMGSQVGSKLMEPVLAALPTVQAKSP